MKIPSRGAGLLLTYRSQSGEVELLLFRRAIRPHKGYWSFTGGTKNANESFADCAARETSEEACGHRSFNDFFKEFLPSGFAMDTTRMHRTYYFPFLVDWRTYLVTFVEKPPIQRLRLNCENSEANWFPVSDLPHNVHPGVRRSVRAFRLTS